MPGAAESRTREEGRAAKAGLPRMNSFGWTRLGGIRLVVASFAALCGVTGILAGCFEINQGNIDTDGFVITTINPEHIYAGELTYFAVTIIPNMLLTGITAIIVSTIAVVWATWFVHRRHGPLVLLCLFVAQTLVGGGWILDMGIITVVLATRAGKPLDWWRQHLSEKTRRLLDRLLMPSLACYAVISFVLIALTIMIVDDTSWWKFLEPLATLMFIPMILMMLGALAHDIDMSSTAD